jgi:hypothetical protein
MGRARTRMPVPCGEGKKLRMTRNEKGKSCVYKFDLESRKRKAARKVRNDARAERRLMKKNQKQLLKSRLKQFQSARMGKMLKAFINKRKGAKQPVRRSSRLQEKSS